MLGFISIRSPCPCKVIFRWARDKVCSCPNSKPQDCGSVSIGWQLAQDTCAHKAQDPVQGHKTIPLDKLGDAVQGKFSWKKETTPVVKPFTTGRDPSLVRQTSEKLPPLDPLWLLLWLSKWFFALSGPKEEWKGRYIETRACLGSFGNG